MLKPWNCLQQGRLDILRQRRRDAVGVNRRGRRVLPAPDKSDAGSYRRTAPPYLQSTGNNGARPLIWPEYIRRAVQIGPYQRVSRLARPRTPQDIWRLTIRSVRVENGSGGSSPGCEIQADQSMVLPSRRGGVPVFSRPSEKPAEISRSDRPSAGASPTRPAEDPRFRQYG